MLLIPHTSPVAEKVGEEKTVELLAKAGFDGLDYSAFHLRGDDSPLLKDNYKEHCLNLKRIAEENGTRFVQAHAPFQYMDDTAEYFNNFGKRVIRAMESASILGAEIIVVHPIQNLVYSENKYKLYDLNMEYYNFLIPYAEKFGIKIACENMFQCDRYGICDSVCASPDEFNKYVDDLNSPWITACLDLGHCGVCGRTAQDMIRAMGGERITALHVHDNNGVTDLHQLPGTVSMEWEEICKALAEIDYKGNFTYETDNFIRYYGEDFLPTALKFMHDCGRYYIAKIEKYKNMK